MKPYGNYVLNTYSEFMFFLQNRDNQSRQNSLTMRPTPAHRMENQWTKIKEKRDGWTDAQVKKEIKFLTHLVQEFGLSKVGHEMRRQAREADKKAGKRTGKRKADEQEVRAIANAMGATVAGTAAEERNGYRDDLNGPAQANPGPPAKASKKQQPAGAVSVPAAEPTALDWSQHLKVIINVAISYSFF